MSHTITELLEEWSAGDNAALSEVIEHAHHELIKVAKAHLFKESRKDHTLQTGALINEVYLRLVNQQQSSWAHRREFYAFASKLMRRILVDHARKHRAQRRGGDQHRISIEDLFNIADKNPLSLDDQLDLDRVLGRLEEKDRQMCEVVELRYFAGLSIQETASVLDVSTSTIKREWEVAKLWLAKELGEERRSRI